MPNSSLDWTHLLFYQQGMKIPVSLHPRQPLMGSWLIFANLIQNMSWVLDISVPWLSAPPVASGQKGLPGSQGWCGWKRSLCFTLHFPDHLWGWTSFLYVYRRFQFSVLWIPFVPFIFHSIMLFFLFLLNYRSLYIFWMLTFFDFTYQYLLQLCDLYFYFLCSDFSFLVIFSCNIVRFTIFLVICIFYEILYQEILKIFFHIFSETYQIKK